MHTFKKALSRTVHMIEPRDHFVEVEGKTYLVTKSELDNLLKDMKRDGATFSQERLESVIDLQKSDQALDQSDQLSAHDSPTASPLVEPMQKTLEPTQAPQSLILEP